MEGKNKRSGKWVVEENFNTVLRRRERFGEQFSRKSTEEFRIKLIFRFGGLTINRRR